MTPTTPVLANTATHLRDHLAALTIDNERRRRGHRNVAPGSVIGGATVKRTSYRSALATDPNWMIL